MNDQQENYEERAAILEYDGGYTRHQAEAIAWRMVYDRPGRSESIFGREHRSNGVNDKAQDQFNYRQQE